VCAVDELNQDPFLAERLGTPCLNEVLGGLLVRYEGILSTLAPAGHLQLWFLRCPRGGEFLDVRVQGHPDTTSPQRERARTALLDLVDEASRQERPALQLLPALPYHRDPMVFAGEPFIGDELFVALFTRCLVRSASVVFGEIREGKGLVEMREGLFLQFLVAGLQACDFSAEEQVQYCKYHRDWILRFPYWRAGRPQADIDAATQRNIHTYEQHINTHRQQLERFWRVAREHLAPGSRVELSSSKLRQWQESFEPLFRRIEVLIYRPSFYRDPYADIPIFSMVFKVFNMISNQLGLGAREAFAAHLLYRGLCRNQGNETFAD
jgi:hypothetical protein